METANTGAAALRVSIMSGRDRRRFDASPRWDMRFTTLRRASPLVPPQINQHKDGKRAAVTTVSLLKFGDGRFRLIDVLRNGIP